MIQARAEDRNNQSRMFDFARGSRRFSEVGITRLVFSGFFLSDGSVFLIRVSLPEVLLSSADPEAVFHSSGCRLSDSSRN